MPTADPVTVAGPDGWHDPPETEPVYVADPTSFGAKPVGWHAPSSGTDSYALPEQDPLSNSSTANEHVCPFAPSHEQDPASHARSSLRPS